MKNADAWTPSKFERSAARFRASRDTRFVQISSRLVTDIQARVYPPLIARYARGELLDLGCGGVPLFAMYREHVDRVTCVDWSNSGHSQRHIDVAHDLNEPLPLPSESFDTLVVTDVIEHIRNPEQLWDEMVRLLRPNGHLILTVPFLYWIHEQPHDYHRFTEYKLADFCHRRALEVLELTPYGGAPEVLCDVFAKVIRGIPALCAIYVACAGLVCRLPPLDLVSRNTCRRFPLGYVLVARRSPQPLVPVDRRQRSECETVPTD